MSYGARQVRSARVLLGRPNPEEVRRVNRDGSDVGTKLRVRLLGGGSTVQLRREVLEDERGDLGRRAVVGVEDQLVRSELVELSR